MTPSSGQPPPPTPPEQPPPPPPPPLPKRNSDIYHLASEHSIIYGHESQYPQLKIKIPSNSGYGYSSLESALSDRSKLQALMRRPSLPSRLTTAELNIQRLTPQSEEESLVIETKEYVKDIKKRRKDIHATMLRERTPGERLRRMLSYRIEQRLVKVLSDRKSRSGTKKRPKKSAKKTRLYHKSKGSYRNKNKIRKFFQSHNFFGKVMGKPRKSQLKTFILDYDKSPDDSDSCDCSLRSPSPRFIVDRQGEIRWPPIKLSDQEPATENVGNENFSFKTPLSPTDSSQNAPRVLGWLQVKL